MDKRGSAWVFVILLVIFIAFILILGRFGGNKAQEENSRCTLGFGSGWCWVWETQVYDEAVIYEDSSGEGGGSTSIG